MGVKDGLYLVVTSYLCAGFVVENGAVTECAPILKRKISYWETVAVYIPGSVTASSTDPEGHGQVKTAQRWLRGF